MSEKNDKKTLERIKRLKERLAPSVQDENVSKGIIRGRVFWGVNFALLLVALFIRLKSPTIILNTWNASRTVRGSNIGSVCEKVGNRLYGLETAKTSRVYDFDGQVRVLDEYLKKGILEKLDFGEDVIDLRLIQAFWALKRDTGEWCARKSHTEKDVQDFQVRTRRYRRYFGPAARHRKLKAPPPWHIMISRASMGLTEGMLAPVCIAWRTLNVFLHPRDSEIVGILSAEWRLGGDFGVKGMNNIVRECLKVDRLPSSLKLETIFAPRDSRRDGPLFYLFAIYGSVVCFAFNICVAERTKWRFFSIVGTFALIYGVMLFCFFILQYNAIAFDWICDRIHTLLSALDRLIT